MHTDILSCISIFFTYIHTYVRTYIRANICTRAHDFAPSSNCVYCTQRLTSHPKQSLQVGSCQGETYCEPSELDVALSDDNELG